MNDDGGQDWPELDKQVEFFLDRQEQILEWANLAGPAHEAAYRLISMLEVDADEIGPGWQVGELVAGEQNVGPAVFRPSWCVTTAGVPDVAIAVSTDARDIDPAGVWPSVRNAYVGVLCSALTPAGKVIKQHLKEHPLPLSVRGMKKGSHWSVFGYFAPDRSWWRHLGGWRAGIIGHIRETALAYDFQIEAAVAKARGQ